MPRCHYVLANRPNELTTKLGGLKDIQESIVDATEDICRGLFKKHSSGDDNPHAAIEEDTEASFIEKFKEKKLSEQIDKQVDEIEE